MFPSYETIKWFYDNNCYTNSNIKEFVDLGCITQKDYEFITGEDFPKSETPEPDWR